MNDFESLKLFFQNNKILLLVNNMYWYALQSATTNPGIMEAGKTRQRYQQYYHMNIIECNYLTREVYPSNTRSRKWWQGSMDHHVFKVETQV